METAVKNILSLVTDSFYKILALVTVSTSILLVIIGDFMPAVHHRAHVIVYGHEALFIALLIALGAHAVYERGFNKAMQQIKSANGNRRRGDDVAPAP